MNDILKVLEADDDNSKQLIVDYIFVQKEKLAFLEEDYKKLLQSAQCLEQQNKMLNSSLIDAERQIQKLESSEVWQIEQQKIKLQEIIFSLETDKKELEEQLVKLQETIFSLEKDKTEQEKQLVKLQHSLDRFIELL